MGGRRATSAPVPTGCTQGSPGVGTGRRGGSSRQGLGWAASVGRDSGWEGGTLRGKTAKATGRGDPARARDAGGPSSQQGAQVGLGGGGGRDSAMLDQRGLLILKHKIRWQLKKKKQNLKIENYVLFGDLTEDLRDSSVPLR